MLLIVDIRVFNVNGSYHLRTLLIFSKSSYAWEQRNQLTKKSYNYILLPEVEDGRARTSELLYRFQCFIFHFLHQCVGGSKKATDIKENNTGCYKK